jgi:hypothetical protein
LKSLKIGILESDVAKFIVMGRSFIKLENQSLSTIYLCYRELGMSSEIEGVRNSISKLREEVKDLGYLREYESFKIDREREKFFADLEDTNSNLVKRINAILSATSHKKLKKDS